jgi:NAD(P)H-hydrate epimerase
MEDIRPMLRAGDVVIDAAYARSLVPRRPFGAHKWGVGGLLIVAGAPHYVGAPLLCALAAGRAGAGIVTLAVPRGIVGAIASRVPEAVYLVLPEIDGQAGGRRAAEVIGKRLEKVSAIVVGPGLGDDEATHHLLDALWGAAAKARPIGFGATVESAAAAAAGPFASGTHPVVLDADALNWLASQEGWWERLPRGRAVLTPHLGEMARLTQRDPAELAADPIGAAREAARTWGQVVVLKYGFTVATDGDRTMLAGDAPRSLATAGSGDVLAGIVGAFLAQGLAPLDAASLAIYVGSRAARRVEARFGILGVVAGDLPVAAAEELAALEREEANR